MQLLLFIFSYINRPKYIHAYIIHGYIERFKHDALEHGISEFLVSINKHT